jgi:hypothetical protein
VLQVVQVLNILLLLVEVQEVLADQLVILQVVEVAQVDLELELEFQ